jgi:hypothetical protein
MWVSDVLPGRVNDLAAAKEQVFAVLRPFTAVMSCLADGGYEPAGHGICTPVKKPRGAPGLDISDDLFAALATVLRQTGMGSLPHGSRCGACVRGTVGQGLERARH